MKYVVGTKKDGKSKKALTLDYTSSEEDGEGENRHCLITVSLSWESSKLRRYKDQLDKVHLENPTRHAIVQQKQRKMKTTMTSRAAPDKAPAWAVNISHNVEDVLKQKRYVQFSWPVYFDLVKIA